MAAARQIGWSRAGLSAGVLLTAFAVSGCGTTRQWWRNGWKVGPNYCPPAVDVSDQWLDADNPAVQSEPADYSCWWSVFGDPVLNGLVDAARQQNVPLRIAAWRIVEARAQLGVAAGNLLPQKQNLVGAYTRNRFSSNAFPFGEFPIREEYDDWRIGFDMAWELDIWGRIRRLIESADAGLDAQVENYRDVLVMTQAEVAATYIQLRALEERLALARKNVQIQQETLRIIQRRLEAGVVSEIDLRQAKANLAATEALIPALEEAHRKAQNGLCVLLGVPPQDLRELLGAGTIPSAPTEVVVGVPAELLRRRPDVRRAERQLAAQSAQIGVAIADLYPQIAITGTISLNAEQVPDLFRGSSLAGVVGPGLQWKILNYGRVRNNIRVQNARFQQLLAAYQDAVLRANMEAENAIVALLKERAKAEALARAVEETERALELGLLLYQQGVVDYQRVLDVQRVLVQQQDALAESQGKVALNLVAVYKALGGGWPPRPAPAEQTEAGEAEGRPAAPAEPSEAGRPEPAAEEAPSPSDVRPS